MAVIRGAGEPAASVEPKAVPEAKASLESKPTQAAPEPQVTPGPVSARAQLVSPRARRRAETLGVDLAAVKGTGPGGAIELADVERAVSASRTPPQPSTPAPMRRAIAAAMARSKREIPHYYLETRIDMSRTMEWLRAENERRAVERRLLPAVILLKAVARALVEVPDLNGYWIGEAFRPGAGIHIGMAIAMKGGGLVAPAIHDVDRRSYDELMADLQDLIPRARAGRLRSSEMTDATITVTSLGDLGVDRVLGVIYPPQVALVGFGRITEQPWAEGGVVDARPVVSASLAADHRASDGLVGARFLDVLARHLRAAETA
jgi:pyruvate dehydrogenase E2 component (dihydrolipoamide acetyltransferase)